MSWLKALDLLLKANEIKGHVDEVKRIHDYAKKVDKADPKKLSWDDLKYFNNETMDKATAGIRDIEKKTNNALKAELQWPESGSLNAFLNAEKIADKHGIDSPQAKKAIEAYAATLQNHDKGLNALAKDLTAKKSEIDEKIKIINALRDYARVLRDAFMACAKIPSLTGTAQNAMFFSLSQDAQQYAGIAGNVASSMSKLASRNSSYINEVDQKIKDNQLWIKWATNDALSKEGNLKKNEKATKPKK